MIEPFWRAEAATRTTSSHTYVRGQVGGAHSSKQQAAASTRENKCKCRASPASYESLHSLPYCSSDTKPITANPNSKYQQRWPMLSHSRRSLTYGAYVGVIYQQIMG